MVGRTISHYRIVRELGAGGMGVVFAAEDLRLGRQVAVKFVPDAMADDKQLFERLRSEARTASSLNHPNICILHDIGESDGRPFIVMELLQGRTLRERLAAGPVKVHETLDVGIQVADALDAAHRQHVIHRDIKPANLFLTDRGSVKILDFGLAKVVGHQPSALTAAPTGLTTAGMTLGTVSYMSPEQVTGDPLDGRSDLFSFGVVLYECVTGHQPFKGKTSGVILSEILTRAPTAPVVLNPDLPVRLQEIINNCLEKDRELRYQDAAALRTDLKRLKRDLESGPRSVSRTIAIEAALAGSATTNDTPGFMPSSTAAPAATVPGARPQNRYGIALGAIAAIAFVTIAVAFYVFRSSNAEPAAVKRTPVAQGIPASQGDDSSPLSQRQSASLPSPPEAAVGDAAAVTARKQELARVPAPAARPSAGQAQAIAQPPPLPPATPSGAGLSAVAVSPPPPVAPVVPQLPVVQTDLPRPTAVPAVAAQSPSGSVASTTESDDVAIRRVVAAYAHAIESKDVEAFRSVKPNLSGAEQRRLEDSFKSVSSQRVDITVLSIEHHAEDAVVRVHRRDTLTAGGRAQTSDSQQTMTLIRSGAGWVISEIGR